MRPWTLVRSIAAAASIAAGICLSAATVQQTEAPAPCFVDQGDQDSALALFKGILRRTVARRDGDALLRMVDRLVDRGRDQASGITPFTRGERPRDRESAIWPALERVIDQPGVLARGVYCVPAAVCSVPDRDAGRELAVLEKRVNVYATPSRGTAPIAVLSCGTVVTEDPAMTNRPAAPAGWRPVLAGEPRRWGFVEDRFVMSGKDYRLKAAKRDGWWTIIAWYARR